MLFYLFSNYVLCSQVTRVVQRITNHGLRGCSFFVGLRRKLNEMDTGRFSILYFYLLLNYFRGVFSCVDLLQLGIDRLSSVDMIDAAKLCVVCRKEHYASQF